MLVLVPVLCVPGIRRSALAMYSYRRIPKLKQFVQDAAATLPGILEVEELDLPPAEAPPVLGVTFTDFLPRRESSPWTVYCMLNEKLPHPLFAERLPCVELMVKLGAFEVEAFDYLDKVTGFALPLIDFQRFCPGVGATWDPDTGRLHIKALVRVTDPGSATLPAEVSFALRSVMALTYLVSLKLWQLRVRDLLPLPQYEAIESQLRIRMLKPLGVARESSEAQVSYPCLSRISAAA